MPYELRKVRDKLCYMVKNIENGKIKAKCTSLSKAKKQLKKLM